MKTRIIKILPVILSLVLLSGCMGTTEFGPVKIPTILVQVAVIVGVVYFAWFRKKEVKNSRQSREND